jgi:hypothetical protein
MHADTERTGSRQPHPAAGDSPEAKGIKVLAPPANPDLGAGPGRCSDCGTSRDVRGRRWSA